MLTCAYVVRIWQNRVSNDVARTIVPIGDAQFPESPQNHRITLDDVTFVHINYSSFFCGTSFDVTQVNASFHSISVILLSFSMAAL